MTLRESHFDALWDWIRFELDAIECLEGVPREKAMSMAGCRAYGRWPMLTGRWLVYVKNLPNKQG